MKAFLRASSLTRRNGPAFVLARLSRQAGEPAAARSSHGPTRADNTAGPVRLTQNCRRPAGHRSTSVNIPWWRWELNSTVR